MCSVAAVVAAPLCDVRAQQIVTGASHACPLLPDATVRCWGANYAGQFGDGTSTFRSAPVAVTGLRDVVQKIVK
jgi:alpha-tubulin suppressor-like RCC1 family protein